MNTSVLEDLGISPMEIKVFLMILETGESKAGRIIEKTGLQSSSVYHAIHALIARGLVSYLKKSEVKYYRAAEPETILDYIDLKKQEFLKLLPNLQARRKKEKEEGVEFFKSFKGIKILHLKLLKNAEKSDVYRVFSVDNPEDYEKARQGVFQPIKVILKQKRLVMRGIFSEKNRYAPTKSSRMQKRYLDAPLPPNTAVVGENIAMISWKGEPSGVLIHSKDLAEQYAAFFDALWKIAKR